MFVAPSFSRQHERSKIENAEFAETGYVRFRDETLLPSGAPPQAGRRVKVTLTLIVVTFRTNVIGAGRTRTRGGSPRDERRASSRPSRGNGRPTSSCSIDDDTPSPRAPPDVFAAAIRIRRRRGGVGRVFATTRSAPDVSQTDSREKRRPVHVNRNIMLDRDSISGLSNFRR